MGEASTPEWLPDPGGTHEWRFWDGRAWTAHVADGATVTEDPLDRDAGRVLGSPLPPPPPAPSASAPAPADRGAGRGWWVSRTAVLVAGVVLALLLTGGAFAVGYVVGDSGSTERAPSKVPTSCSAEDILGVARDWSGANDRYYASTPDSAEEEEAYAELDTQERRLGRTVARCS
jgi:hypothetical protein